MNHREPISQEQLDLTSEEPTERAEPEIVTGRVGRLVALDGDCRSEVISLPTRE